MGKYDLKYVKTPVKPIKITKKVGNNMKKETTTPAPKTYNKTRSEHAKDILIAMLITAIAAFIGGMQFESSQQAEVQKAAHSAVAPVTVTKK